MGGRGIEDKMGGLHEFIARRKGVVVCCGDGCVVPVYGVDEGVAAGIIHKIVDIALVIGVTARVIWEAAAVTIVDAAEGTVVAETDAAGVVHDVAVVAAGIVTDGGVEYSVMSAVVGVMVVSDIGIEGELVNDVVAAVVSVKSGVTSAVIAVVAVSSIIVKDEQHVCHVVTIVGVIAADTNAAGVVCEVVVVVTAVSIVAIVVTR